jgi:hypothetical protein
VSLQRARCRPWLAGIENNPIQFSKLDEFWSTGQPVRVVSRPGGRATLTAERAANQGIPPLVGVRFADWNHRLRLTSKSPAGKTRTVSASTSVPCAAPSTTESARKTLPTTDSPAPGSGWPGPKGTSRPSILFPDCPACRNHRANSARSEWPATVLRRGSLGRSRRGRERPSAGCDPVVVSRRVWINSSGRKRRRLFAVAAW